MFYIVKEKQVCGCLDLHISRQFVLNLIYTIWQSNGCINFDWKGVDKVDFVFVCRFYGIWRQECWDRLPQPSLTTCPQPRSRPLRSPLRTRRSCRRCRVGCSSCEASPAYPFSTFHTIHTFPRNIFMLIRFIVVELIYIIVFIKG